MNGIRLLIAVGVKERGHVELSPQIDRCANGAVLANRAVLQHTVQHLH